MAHKEDKIKSMLGAGLSAETVASAVGVDPSYISQLLSDETFSNEVIELRSKSLIAHTARDLSLDSLEDKAITQLDDMLQEGRFNKPGDMLNFLRVVNGAKRRGNPVVHSVNPVNTVINLTLPSVVKQRFIVSNKGEVLEVNGQTLVTMSSSQLVKQISDQRGEDNEGDFNKLGRSIQKVS